MIEHKLLYYPRKAQFEQEKDNIADTSIAFIEDSGTIYTHKNYFGGSSSGVDPSDLVSLEQRLNDELGIRLSREINALAGTITDMATKNYVDSQLTNFGQSLNITNRVQQVLDAQTPSWKAVVERIGRLEGSNQEILNQIAEIVASTTDQGSQVDLSAVYTRLYNLENAQAADETWKVQTTARINALATGDSATLTLEAIYSAIDSDVERQIVSKIFQQANENGSSITLHADKINLEGDTSELEAFINGVVNITSPDGSSFGYLYAKGIVFEDNSSTPHTRTELTSDNGLRHVVTSGPDANGTNGGYWLKPDGSGQLAFGNISWNRDGKLTVQGIIKPDAANSIFEIDRIYMIPTTAYASSDYSYEVNIHYNIIKDGFSVKDGNLENVRIFWRDSSSVGSVNASDNTYIHRFAYDSTNTETQVDSIRVFACYAPTYTDTTQILAMLRDLPLQTYQNVFKINGNYIFENGETVTIRCTDCVMVGRGGNSKTIYLDDIANTNQSYNGQYFTLNEGVLARHQIPTGTIARSAVDSTTATYTKFLNHNTIEELVYEMGECLQRDGYFDVLPQVRYYDGDTWHSGYFYNDGKTIEDNATLNDRNQPMRYIDVIYVLRNNSTNGDFWYCIDSTAAATHAPGDTGADTSVTGWDVIGGNPMNPYGLENNITAGQLSFTSKGIVFNGTNSVSWTNRG